MRLILLLVVLFTSLHSKSIFIFYPFYFNEDSLKTAIMDEFQGYNIEVFGKYSLLKKAMGEIQPCLLISTPSVIHEYDSLFPNKYLGSKQGSQLDEYVKISLRPEVLESSQYYNMKIGSVSNGNRESTNRIIEQLLNTENLSVKRVTKLGDIISLLRFNIIDFAVIKKYELDVIREFTKQQVYHTDLQNSTIKRVTAAWYKPSSCIEQLNKASKVKNILRIDNWENTSN